MQPCWKALRLETGLDDCARPGVDRDCLVPLAPCPAVFVLGHNDFQKVSSRLTGATRFELATPCTPCNKMAKRHEMLRSPLIQDKA
jgi:hypothetical protein